MAGAAKKFNLTELLNQRSKEAGEQQKTEQQQAAAGAEVVTSEEGVSSTAYLRPYTVKGQFLQRGRRARLKTVY